MFVALSEWDGNDGTDFCNASGILPIKNESRQSIQTGACFGWAFSTHSPRLADWQSGQQTPAIYRISKLMSWLIPWIFLFRWCFLTSCSFFFPLLFVFSAGDIKSPNKPSRPATIRPKERSSEDGPRKYARNTICTSPKGGCTRVSATRRHRDTFLTKFCHSPRVSLSRSLLAHQPCDQRNVCSAVKPRNLSQQKLERLKFCPSDLTWMFQLFLLFEGRMPHTLHSRKA